MSHARPVDPPAPPIPPTAESRRRRSWRRFFWTAGAVLLGGLMFLAVGVGGAEYYTSRPTFCGSCHVMDPYYTSWSHDIHGRKFGVLCVDCHYAPGERFTIKAKFKGLSQVTSYFSGRYGAGRPRAHVADSSCLTSGCHGDMEFMGKMLTIGEPRKEMRLMGAEQIEVTRTPTVHFFHEKHLRIDDKLKDNAAGLAEIDARLKAALPPEALARILSATTSIGPAHDRDAVMRKLLDELQASDPVREDAWKRMELEHRATRLHQLSGLNCAACHTFDASGVGHITVEHASCFTCHFTNEAFNRGTAECLRCHEAPTRSILVHDRPSASVVSPVLMDHQDIVRRNVDCASCHFDVVRGDTRVTARDCERCHDQAKFLEGFDARTTETVRKYHEQHVHAQRARCVDCHRTMQHGLLDPMHAGEAGFLQPVMNDCTHCHPGHHTEQVALLTGVGGAGLAQHTPNAMLGSRLNCRACHTQSAEDLKGDELLRATQQSCVGCHSDDYIQLFDQWKSELATYVRESEARLETLSAAAVRAEAEGRPLTDTLRQKLAHARENVRLVQTGGGMHNRHFALQLLDAARLALDDVDAALRK